jgi:hypothetical protein
MITSQTQLQRLHDPAARDVLVNALARLAYYYPVELDAATREADDDQLEAIARRLTTKLKDEIRAAITGD